MLIQHNLPKTNTNIELKQKLNKQYHNFNDFDTISFKSKIVPTKSFAKQKFINKLLKKNLCKCGEWREPHGVRCNGFDLPCFDHSLHLRAHELPRHRGGYGRESRV